jgi:hypothetical protein
MFAENPVQGFGGVHVKVYEVLVLAQHPETVTV